MTLNPNDTINVILHQASKENAADYNHIFWIVGVFVAIILIAINRRKLQEFLINIKPTEYQVSIPGFQIQGNLRYKTLDQEVAWKIYIELATRITGNKLEDGTGILRESLNSLYSIFGVLRTLLKDSGAQLAKQPQKGSQYTVATLLLEIMNKKLRPFLSEWHPKLQAHEKIKAENDSQFAHEKKWDENEALRKQLNSLQEGLAQYIKTLQEIAQGKVTVK